MQNGIKRPVHDMKADIKDLFALQDEITLKIITEMAVNLTVGETARVYAIGTENLDAYFKAWKAQMNFLSITQDGNQLAKEMAKEVIELDPEYPDGYVILGWTHYMDAGLGWSKHYLKGC